MNTPDDPQRAPSGRDPANLHEDAARDQRSSPADAPDERLSPWQITFSTLAAAFGVQSSRNRERDFSRGKPSHFIIAGVLFTVGFVVVMVLLVSLVLRNVGG